MQVPQASAHHEFLASSRTPAHMDSEPQASILLANTWLPMKSEGVITYQSESGAVDMNRRMKYLQWDLRPKFRYI